MAVGCKTSIKQNTATNQITPRLGNQGQRDKKMNAYEIMNLDANNKVLGDYYKSKLVGNGGQTYSRLYLDLDDNTLSEANFASCNTWYQRDDGSLIEIDAHNNYGADLSAEELKWLEEDGLSDFGWADFCAEIEAAIEEALA